MKSHEFDVVSFVFGVIFIGLALTGVFADEDITLLEARWVWPGILVTAGLAVVVFTIGRDSKPETDSEQPYDPVD